MVTQLQGEIQLKCAIFHQIHVYRYVAIVQAFVNVAHVGKMI